MEQYFWQAQIKELGGPEFHWRQFFCWFHCRWQKFQTFLRTVDKILGEIFYIRVYFVNWAPLFGGRGGPSYSWNTGEP